jgi:diaminopimelate epimerase
MRFEKWQALGNDYVIIEERNLRWALTPSRVARICAAHTGVGADGVLLLSPSEDRSHVARLRIFNPDGSEAELSGNGARQVFLYLRRNGLADRDEFVIDTPAGPIRARITGASSCSVELGRAATVSADYPGGPGDGRAELEVDGARFAFQHVSIGNPQCAIHVSSPEELATLPIAELGPGIERNALFPNRTNVSWYCELAPGIIRARIFERGVGETLASGTGASGAAVAYHLRGGPPEVVVHLDGGELGVQIDDDLSVTLAGSAAPVLRGELSGDFMAELDAAE